MVSKTRAERISNRIREELSDILIYNVADPRLAWVSITDVQVDREVAFASIYVSSMDGSARAEEILDGLNHARGFLKRELSQRIELRTFPELRFYWDPTPEQAEHIEKLIDSLSDTKDTEEGADPDEQDLD